MSDTLNVYSEYEINETIEQLCRGHGSQSPVAVGIFVKSMNTVANLQYLIQYTNCCFSYCELIGLLSILKLIPI